MRACAMLESRHGIALLVNSLYVVYTIVIFAISTYLWLLYDDSKCRVLLVELSLIYRYSGSFAIRVFG